MNNEKKQNGSLIIILLIIVTVFVFFFPKINDMITKVSMPKVEKGEIQKQEEKKEITEEILETIHYPLMRNSIYNSNTYYSYDKLTYKDIANEDLLLTAFLDIYEGNMTGYEGVGSCTNISKQFNKKYLELRFKNIIGNTVNYTLTDFYVPEDSESNYKGTWRYDVYNSRFVYQGLCNSNIGSVRYYNLEELIKHEYDNKDIVAYYYVGFAKVENNNYVIYKDAIMTEKIDEGTFIDLDQLNAAFKNVNKKEKNMYKYTFKNTLCSYNEYCFYEGKWTNEL